MVKRADVSSVLMLSVLVCETDGVDRLGVSAALLLASSTLCTLTITLYVVMGSMDEKMKKSQDYKVYIRSIPSIIWIQTLRPAETDRLSPGVCIAKFTSEVNSLLGKCGANRRSLSLQLMSSLFHVNQPMMT